MTTKISNEIKERILNGAVFAGGKVRFDSIGLALRDMPDGRMEVRFICGNVPVAYMYCDKPNFAAGESLTITGINGTIDITLGN